MIRTIAVCFFIILGCGSIGIIGGISSVIVIVIIIDIGISIINYGV